MGRTDTRYTWSGDFSIAYQVTGAGPSDLMYLPAWFSNVVANRSVPEQGRFLERLETFARLIVMDRRGVGCSDRLPPGHAATLEELVDAYVRDALPSLLDRPDSLDAVRSLMALTQGAGAGIAEIRKMSEVDLIDLLPSIRVPTLVLHRTDDPVEPIESGRLLAERIPDARFVELPGVDALPWAGEQDAVLDEIEEFVTGARGVHGSDRRLATVLFTDIVGSTRLASSLGDAAWHELLGKHHASVRAELERNRGVEVDTAGDGFFATFDGPARAVECARSIGEAVRPLGIEVRAGVHTGEVEVSRDEFRGISLHIGARVMALAEPSEVLVTSTVKDLVAGSGLVFRDAGEHELKGVPDRWRLYRVVG